MSKGRPTVILTACLWACAPAIATCQTWLDPMQSCLGCPPAPPFIVALGVVAPGKTVNDPSLPPRGPAMRSVYKEFQVLFRGHSQLPILKRTVTTEFDEKDREISQVDNENN